MEERVWPNLVAAQDEDAVDVLYDRIGVLSAQIHALGAELVQSLAEFDSVDGWVGDGYKTFSQWISTRTRFSVPESQRLSRAASAAESMPTLMGAARQGQVSVGVLADAARVVTPENESRVADVVLACTAAQSSRVLSKFRDLSAVPDPADSSTGDDAAEPATEPALESWWRTWWDDAGRGHIDAALDPVTAEMMRQAWSAARAAGERDAAGAPLDDAALNEAESDGRLTADEIASRLAATMLEHADGEGLRAPGGDHFLVQLHIDVETFAELMGLEFDASLPVRLGSECFLAGSGRHLTSAQAAELACGARVQVLIESQGVPLWMGEEPAAANRWQRRAMTSRSGKACCELPGCTQTEYLHAHHVVYRSHDGRTSLENLVFLCGEHHRRLHKENWTVTTEGDQRFTFWNGRRCLGTTVVGERAGRPPDLARLPFIERPPDAPPGTSATATLSDTGGERLTPWAMSAYLEHLFAA